MPGAALHIAAPMATWRLHAVGGTDPESARYVPSRVRLHHSLIDEFMAGSTEIAADQRVAVVTAGPPAAGKSTRLTQLGFDATWRRIDSDVFKMMLIKHDIQAGVLAFPGEVRNRVLTDGMGVMPLEFSGLYHRESTVVADKALEASMAARENVVIEGTLSWKGLVPQLVDDVLAHDYRQLDVVLVEAPLEDVLEQSLGRWWPDRIRGGLGGRFTPAATIRDLYRTRLHTVSADNALALARMARTAGIRTQLIR